MTAPDTSHLSLRIAHLYPSEMNLYGDRGNVLALYQRCAWRGISATVTPIETGDTIDSTEYDLYFMGGGQDTQQHRIDDDFVAHKGPFLKQAVANGAVVLGVCGGYQLLGHYFDPIDDERIEGIGLLDVHTIGSTERLIGNLVIDRKGTTLVGFENHSGQTHLGEKATPLGTVIKGNGNNSKNPDEGAQQGTVFGTYMHGSLLPKNPAFADELITLALKRRHGKIILAPLDDTFAIKAHKQALTRPV